MATATDKGVTGSSGPVVVEIPFEALAETIPAVADGTIVQPGPLSSTSSSRSSTSAMSS